MGALRTLAQAAIEGIAPSRLRRTPEPMAMTDAESVAAYDDAGAPGAPLFPLHHLLARSLAALAPAGGTVIDLGCGSGRLLEQLARARPDLQVVGYDLSRPMLERGRRRVAEARLENLRLEEGDLLALPVEAIEQLDVLSCHTALHHVPDGGAVARTLARFAAARARHGCALFVSDLIRPRLASTLTTIVAGAERLAPTVRADLRASLAAAFAYDELCAAVDRAGCGRWHHARMPLLGSMQWHWLPADDRSGRTGRSGRPAAARWQAPPLPDEVSDEIEALERFALRRLPHRLLAD
jgi:2-polyprenyl-3-methyl-5-hydroxy-6-metoxy-1,4-benzoquinol methylase